MFHLTIHILFWMHLIHIKLWFKIIFTEFYIFRFENFSDFCLCVYLRGFQWIQWIQWGKVFAIFEEGNIDKIPKIFVKFQILEIYLNIFNEISHSPLRRWTRLIFRFLKFILKISVNFSPNFWIRVDILSPCQIHFDSWFSILWILIFPVQNSWKIFEQPNINCNNFAK